MDYRSYITENVQQVQFFFLRSVLPADRQTDRQTDRQQKTKHYPDAVPSHWPKTNKREFLTIKQTVYSVKNTSTVHDYWYLTVATCFGLSLDIFRATFISKWESQRVLCTVGLQGARESN